MDIHGKQKQQKRTTTFFQFCKADKVRLISVILSVLIKSTGVAFIATHSSKV